jgi:hypothetical protein
LETRHFPEHVRAAIEKLPEPIRDATTNLVTTAFSAGVGVERTRIDGIMSLPSAQGFAQLAWQLAKSNDFTPAEADAVLRTAAVDVVAVAAAGSERQAAAATLH